jgi:nucleolar complex protein 3
MLENEQDVLSGEYRPDVEDPEHSNPFATSAWELANLKFHIHPAVSSQAVAAASGKLLRLPAEQPEKLRAALLQECDELYIPFERHKKKHPLQQTDDKKRPRSRFLKPRRRPMICVEEE